ncbi:hypothetical protein IG631_06163 [Alternaria alternata]|nr:hypothetical protein IG631_06163 [Alternaria alternata]
MWQLTLDGYDSRNFQRPEFWEIYDAGPRRGRCQLYTSEWHQTSSQL